MEAIIVAVISVIGSFVVVYLSTIKEHFTQKYEVKKEQLEKFYIPFYQKYCAGFLSVNKLSEMGFETRAEYLDLFTQNIHLMESKSQSLYQDFYLAFLNMLEADNDHPDFPLEQCCQNLDSVFNDIANAILQEYKDILKKCHLPVPSI